MVQEGNFTSTATGSELPYTNWGTHEPDNRDGAEHCINMKGATGAWIDRRCDRTAPSVCELERKWIASENKVLYKRTGYIEPIDKLPPSPKPRPSYPRNQSFHIHGKCIYMEIYVEREQ